MNRNWLTRIHNNLNRKPKKGPRGRTPRLGLGPKQPATSPERQVGKAGRKGPPRPAADPAGLDEFLDVPAEADVQAAQELVTEVDKLGVAVPGPEQVRLVNLERDPQAVAVAEKLVTALEWCPEVAAETHTDATQLADEDRQAAELGQLDEVLGHAGDAVAEGLEILDGWRAEAQAEIASGLLGELAGARTRDEQLAIVEDGAEVLRIEADALKADLQTRRKNADEMGALQAEWEDLNRRAELSQIMQDILLKNIPPRAVLEDMARYYSELRGDSRQQAR